MQGFETFQMISDYAGNTGIYSNVNNILPV